MTRRWFPAPLLLLATLAASPVAGQEPPADDDPPAFERRYIDVADRRSHPVLLRDWPELTRLIDWSHGLEAAVAGESDTLASAMVEVFRARLDSLEAAPLPEFLAGRADSIRATLGEIRGRLDRAETVLTAPSRRISFMGGVVPNAPERQRTLVTGETAVTVPAGVAVGDTDSLPSADVGPAPEGSFLDHLGEALAGLDRLVHLMRGSAHATDPAANGPPGRPGSTPSPGTAPRRPGP